MPCFAAPTLATLKIASTAALGILTGAHLTFSFSTIQAILSLPSAAHARQAFTTTLLTHTTCLTTPLTVAPSLLLTVTYLISPSRLRHPYLLMASILPLLSLGYDHGVLSHVEKEILHRSSPAKISTAEEDEAAEEEAEEIVNGEIIRGGLEKYAQRNLVKAGVVGLGFLISLVGNWGDGWVPYGYN
ncbi:hypothetical protein BDZ91DRAFT_782669 [Kalaharituber pfeilii]|nr:hypothetical protein BDZ91DRAFT_782669 [Kalaharituber pfeilii]